MTKSPAPTATDSQNAFANNQDGHCGVSTEKAVGEAGAMPGTDGFTMACFKAEDVPVGTKLYIAPVAAAPALYGVPDGKGGVKLGKGWAFSKTPDKALGTTQPLFTEAPASPGIDASPKGGNEGFGTYYKGGNVVMNLDKRASDAVQFLRNQVADNRDAANPLMMSAKGRKLHEAAECMAGLMDEIYRLRQANGPKGGSSVRAQFEAWLAPSWSQEGDTDEDGDFVYREDWVQGAWIGYEAAMQATSAEVGKERCESGSPDCGPVEHWDSDAVPLCARCWNELTASHGAGVSG